jgi:hypothetical protein
LPFPAPPEDFFAAGFAAFLAASADVFFTGVDAEAAILFSSGAFSSPV